MGIMETYERWKREATADPDLIDELQRIDGQEAEISDRFYRELDFGTAGLRGVIGAGDNRMNIYTVRKATQGLADYLRNKYMDAAVVIAYDSRIKSDVFAREAACVLAANKVKAYLFSELEPTPVLSFAVRELGCQSGIVVTASHNPAAYNGYKCYSSAGYQMTDGEAGEVTGYIRRLDIFNDVKVADYDAAVASGWIELVSPAVVDKFLDQVATQQVNPGICEKTPIKVVYTPLNGTGNKPVRRILDRIGIKQVTVVPEQELPDGHFPTAPYPNPEIRQVFECGLKMTETEKADLMLATDPDCDRVGIAVLTNGEYVLLSGNDVGVLLANYILSARQAKGLPTEGMFMTKSFVSTPLFNKVAAKYGCTVVDVLTGFKYVGEFIANLEKKGEENRFLMGFEESYGYLIGTHARDKDAVAASLMICEMAAYYKEQGKTLVDVLNEIYAEFGNYNNRLYNFMFEGASGMVKMAEIMDDTRKSPPAELAGMKVLEVHDFEASTITDTVTGEKRAIALPKSNVLAYSLPNGNFAIVRPSGTEPKIKVYITGCGKTADEAEATAIALGDAMKSLLKIN